MTTITITKEFLVSLYPAGPTGEQREAMAVAGWRLVQGLLWEGCYHPARQGGGYNERISIPCPDGVKVTRGCPGHHAEIAIPPVAA